MDIASMVDLLSEWVGNDNWVVLCFVVVLGSLLIDFAQRRVLRRLEKRVGQTKNPWDDAVLHALIKPISLLIWMFGLTVAAQIAFRSGLNLDTAESVTRVGQMWQIGMIVSVSWFAVRLARGVEANIVEFSRDKQDGPDQTTVDAIGKLVRISIIITAVMVVLSELGVEIGAVMAFGGIGGLAIGLAAKDLLANFFGGLTVYLDRPFKVGDWICSPDRSVEGTVEKIGWRQTTIRKFDKRPIYVPNSTFTTITVENPSRMTHRRIYETIGLRYDDADQVEDIVNSIRKMLREHPEIDQTQTMIVNFNAFAPSSLDFFVYTFTKTTNWIKYHDVKEDVLLQIEKIIRDRGAEIAFPTSTMHVVGPPQFAGMDVDVGTVATKES